MAAWPTACRARTTPPRSPRAARRSGSTASVDLAAYAKVAESVTGIATIPVSVAQLQVSLGAVRALRRRRGRRDRPRRRGGRRPARAHRGRADGVAAARREGGRAVGRLPHVRRRGPDHARVVLRLPGRRRRADTRALDRGARGRDARVAAHLRHPRAVALRRPARGEDARRRADVPRALALDDGRRGRAEHDDAQRVRAEHGVRAAERAGGDRARRCSRRTWAATRSRRSSSSSPATARR